MARSRRRPTSTSFPELSRLIDLALAQSLPEELVHSIVEHNVLERMAKEFAESGALDRTVENALASPRTNELVDRIVNSEEMRRAIREIVASREVREAITQQTTGFVEELAGDIRQRARRLDDRLDRAHASQSQFGGIATRAAALGVDALLIVAVFTPALRLRRADLVAGGHAAADLAGRAAARRGLDARRRWLPRACSGAAPVARRE